MKRIRNNRNRLYENNQNGALAMIADIKNDMFVIVDVDLSDRELDDLFYEKYGKYPDIMHTLLYSENPKYDKMIRAIGDAMIEDEWRVVEVYSMINKYSGNPAYEIPYIYNELCDGMINESLEFNDERMSYEEAFEYLESKAGMGFGWDSYNNGYEIFLGYGTYCKYPFHIGRHRKFGDVLWFDRWHSGPGAFRNDRKLKKNNLFFTQFSLGEEVEYWALTKEVLDRMIELSFNRD